MTFYEAAVEVLRDAGRPLHYKKIAELAQARNLLSHKGRTPDQTMCDRLLQEVKKPPGDTLIVQFKPGIFALKEGVDVSEAKETMALHPPPAPEPVDVDAAAAAPEKEGRGRRRRGRKGEETTSEPAAEAAEAAATEELLPASEREEGSEPVLAVESVDADELPGVESEQGDEEDDDGVESEGAEAVAGGASRDKRRRRRGRRGGKNRVRGEEGEEGSEPAAAAPVVVAPAQSGRPQEQRRPQPPAQPRQPASVAPTGPLASGTLAPVDRAELDASPLTATIIGMMQQSHDLADSLRSLSRGVSRSGAGALGRVGPAMVRAELLRTNQAAQASGRLPTFNEIKPEIWAWGTGLGSELTGSLAGYGDWLAAHVQTLKAGLAQRLSGQAPASFQTLVTLLLSRAGYQQLALVDEVPAGFAACLVGGITAGFSRTRTVFGIVDADTELTSELVEGLESLLATVQGTDAVLVVRSVVAPEVVQTFSTRVRVVDAHDLAQRMIECEVGVRRIPVSIPVFDEPMFRDAASE